MRAIFLDVDGVVATPTSVRLNYLLGRSPDQQWYDLVSLAYLGRLVSETGAIVVLSSTWRAEDASVDPHVRAIMRNLCAQLEAAGAPVADVTPSLPNGDRSTEVGAWLDDHPCDGWVIIDDLARFEDRPAASEGHLVRIEDSGGIRPWHYRRALSTLLEANASPDEGVDEAHAPTTRPTR